MDLFEIEKLEEMNGEDGKPCYIAYDDKVYDVSRSKLWANGIHMRLHHAGSDLTTHLPNAPHGTEVFERYPQIGTIPNAKGPAPEPKAVDTFSLLDRVPFLRRHPHPMIVHFPIALFISTVIFYVLYLIFEMESLEMTAMHCLMAGLFFTPFGIGTGYLTWMINYESRPIKAVRIKIACSWILMAMAAGILVWRFFIPGNAYSGSGIPLYSIMVIALAPLVSIIGWYGGQLTIPLE